MKRLTAVLLILILLTQFGGFTYALTPQELTIPETAEKIIYGSSGAGRELTAYRFGTGKNVMVLGFAIHGFEDHFERDGETLVYTAGKVMQMLSENAALLEQYDWSVYVLPCMNPDGLLDGYTCDGPGRCTTTSLDAAGNLVSGGIDLNRCFPTNWVPFTGSRNYNGSAPLAALEARALYSFIRGVKSDGLNLCIDTHGWYEQIITSAGASGLLSGTFSAGFPQNSVSNLAQANGYFSAYAASIGYEACLFEFPADVYSMDGFIYSGYAERYVRCITSLLNAYGKQSQLPGGQQYPSSVFTDVPPAAWYRESVDFALVNKLFYGTSGVTFSPELPMSRAMLVTVLWRMAGETASSYALPFVDAAPQSWYSTALCWATENGIVSGIDRSHFAPERNVTRQELASILFRYAKLTGADMTPRRELVGYSDAEQVGSFAFEPLCWAVGCEFLQGVTAGGSTLLAPLGSASRAQVAAVLMRYLHKKNEGN